MGMYRLKKMANEAKGKILDIGFAELPNPYLKGKVVGFDKKKVVKPPNYSSVIVGDIRDINRAIKNEKFDTIIAGEIIEHLEDPIGFLRDCRMLLEREGRILISTPNPYYPVEFFLNMFMVKKFYYCKNHLFVIPPRWMVRLLEYTGFRLEKIISGGVALSNKIVLPAPHIFCYRIIYVARKVENDEK